MDRAVTAFRHLALFLLATVMAVCGVYFAWMLAIVVLKLTGRLSDGVMFHDNTMTPGYGDAALALVMCGAVIAACLLLRRKIRRTMAAVPPPA